MKFQINCIVDDEVRAKIKKELLGQVRGIARSVVEETVQAEVTRIAQTLTERFKNNEFKIQDAIRKSITEIVKDSWGEVAREIKKQVTATVGPAVTRAAEKVIAQKLLDKTVWEAEAQDAYIRRVCREEMRKK